MPPRSQSSSNGKAALFAAALVAAVVSVVPLVTVGQAQSGPPILRAALDVVSIDVSVLSRDRKPVRGLRASDFSVFDAGKPRRIVAFAEVDGASRSESEVWLSGPAADVATNGSIARRLTAIVIDDAAGVIEPVVTATARRIA